MGKDGTPGSNGQDGVGITTITINEKGELVIYFSDATSKNLGVISDVTGPGKTVSHSVIFMNGDNIIKEEQVEFVKILTMFKLMKKRQKFVMVL